MKNNLVSIFQRQQSMVHGRLPTLGMLHSLNKGLLAISVLVVAISCTENKKLAAQEKYTCPMHPEVNRDHPGKCPICFMDFVKVGTNEDDGLIHLNESQMRLANISTMPITRDKIEIKTILNGTIVIDGQQTEIISSRVAGRIERLFFKETGRIVSKGQPLYEIYSEELLTLQQELLMALRQAEELKEKRFESFLKSAERKLRLFGMTEGQVATLLMRKKADSKITFLSPASGMLTRIDVSEGEYVSAGIALYRIDKIDRVWVEAQLYPDEGGLAKVGDRVNVRVNGFENIVTQGRIIFFNPELRQGNQIVTLRVELNNSERRFVPGMQADVILSRYGRNTLLLPIDAVIRDSSGSMIWVQARDGSFRMRMVETGEETSDEIEITDGVEENENVVITGAYLLYSESVLKKGLNQHQHS